MKFDFLQYFPKVTTHCQLIYFVHLTRNLVAYFHKKTIYLMYILFIVKAVGFLCLISYILVAFTLFPKAFYE